MKRSVYTCERCGKEEPFTPKRPKTVPRNGEGADAFFYMHACVALNGTLTRWVHNKVTP